MRRLKVAALIMAVSSVGFAGCAAADRVEPASTPSTTPQTQPNGTAEDVQLGDGRNRTASETAEDWATYADHLLVVSVLDERRLEPSAKETRRGEGMIGRIVKLRVDRVLWSAPDAPRPAPSAFPLSVAGWVFNSDSGSAQSVKFALRDSARLEKGHTYVKAVEWLDDTCSDDPAKGTWEGLGSGDTIPYDGGVLGAGEFEGTVRTLDQAKATAQLPGGGMRSQLTGSPLTTLVTTMQKATPRPEVKTPRECNPSDK